MAKKKAIQYDKFTIVDALSAAFSDIESLQDEMQSWYDNMPEGLQSGNKGEAVSEAADALSNVSEVEVPNTLTDNAQFMALTVSVGPLKKRASRASRLDYALGLLQTARDEVDGHINAETVRAEDVKEEAQSVIDELDTAISELEGLEFPGMYG